MSMSRPNKARVAPSPVALKKARDYMAGKPHNAVNIIATMAHHDGFAHAFRGLTRFVLEEATVPRRQRELVILRMGWNCQAQYEFGQHTLMAKANGVTDEEIASVTRPLATHAWSEEDSVLLQMVDDLHQDDCISQDIWDKLESLWTTPEIIEFTASALTYRMVSGFLNSFGVELDEGVPGWPS
jgi:4-carboxymuconolactone decarboxylase